MSSTHGSHWLEREDIGEVTVVRLKTEFPVENTIGEVFEPIYTIVDSLGRNRLVLNLAAAKHLPSAALGELIMLNRKVQVGGGRLALCHLSPFVEEVLGTTHLSDLFSIYPTEHDALQSFA